MIKMSGKIAELRPAMRARPISAEKGWGSMSYLTLWKSCCVFGIRELCADLGRRVKHRKVLSISRAQKKGRITQRTRCFCQFCWERRRLETKLARGCGVAET
jgi:hypothetical protein